MRLIWALPAVLVATANASKQSIESFKETLKINPLPDGKVSAHFEFTTFVSDARPRSPAILHEEDIWQHYTLFPLSLAQILRARGITELHLNVNAGKWNYDSWGLPGDQSVGTGAELWVWMADGAKATINERWKDLVNGLSGLFCASLGGLDEKRTTSPAYAFHPEGELPPGEPHRLLHALLPSESICTENLTPFFKLLPCKSRSGIAGLINPHRVLDADWHGLGVRVIWSNGGIELKLSFGAVLDPVRLSHPNGVRDWSLRSIFDRTILHSCPVATQSTIEVFHPVGDSHQLSPEPTFKQTGGNSVIYDISDVPEELNIAMHWPASGKFQYPPVTPSLPLSIRRVLTGASQFHGGIAYSFKNRQAYPQELVVVDTAPWFINYFLNTREVTVDGVPKATKEVVRHTSYTATVGRQPTLLETTLVIPGNSTTRLTMSFAKSFIAYTEHPPDAERGWDLPPSVISYAQVAEGGGSTSSPAENRLYTLNLLINLPTPDFSMPYNVIIMSSTVIALFFGSVFNLLTRRFIWVRMSKESAEVQ